MDDPVIQAACHGDREARALLLGRLQDRWYRLCLGLLGDRDQARDATQESALRFLRDLPRFRGDSRLETWALGIAVNVVREMRRRMRVVPAGAARARPTLGPERAAELEEARTNLKRALADLPDRQREAIVLRFFEELSVEESAASMQCSPGTVKATVHQALRKLRQALGELV